MSAPTFISIFNARRLAPGVLLNPARAAVILAVAHLEFVR